MNIPTVTTLTQLNTSKAKITKDGIFTTVEWPVVEHLSRADAHTYLATSQIYAVQVGDKPFILKVGQVYKEKFFVNEEGKTILKHRDLTDAELVSVLA
jgi:hypothetical protein